MNFGLTKLITPPSPAAPMQRMWKSLGVVVQDHAGFIEAHYAIPNLSGDADPDTEAELRAQAVQMVYRLVQMSGPVDGDACYLLRVDRKDYRVKLPAIRWERAGVGLHGHA